MERRPCSGDDQSLHEVESWRGHFEELFPGVGSPIWLMSREDGISRDDKGQALPNRILSPICLPPARITDGSIFALSTYAGSVVLKCGYLLEAAVLQSVAAGRGVVVRQSTKTEREDLCIPILDSELSPHPICYLN